MIEISWFSEETLERLYDMYTDQSADMAEARSGADVARVLHDIGGYPFVDEPGIDIAFRYFANLEIDTTHLYNIVQDMQDSGQDVICLVLDYLKRIDSPKNSFGDERLRLQYVSQELKTFAEHFSIPVITAMQTNRESNSIVEAAMRSDKTDIARFMGASNIGSSWAIIEESDWVAIINREKRRSDDQLFMTFKRVKIRGKVKHDSGDYFNHPFTNDKYIRFATDVDRPMSLSIRSLSNDLETIDENASNGRAYSQARPKIQARTGKDAVNALMTEAGLESF